MNDLMDRVYQLYHMHSSHRHLLPQMTLEDFLEASKRRLSFEGQRVMEV